METRHLIQAHHSLDVAAGYLVPPGFEQLFGLEENQSELRDSLLGDAQKVFF